MDARFEHETSRCCTGYSSHRKKVVKWRFYTVEPTFQDTVFLQHLHAYIQDLFRYQCLRGIYIC
jgi:hypothetical protein